MSKFKAITILEVLVTITITTIVIGLSFMVYVHLNKIYLRFDESTNRLQEHIFFRNQITSDWRNCRIPVYKEDCLVLGAKTYRFDGSSILIEQDEVDTLAFEIIDVILVKENDSIIQKIEIIYTNEFQEFNIILDKEFDLKTLQEIEY